MLFNILKTFNGSQDGITTERFQAGTQAELSEYLQGCINKSWVSPVIDNKAINTDGQRPVLTRKVK